MDLPARLTGLLGLFSFFGGETRKMAYCPRLSDINTNVCTGTGGMVSDDFLLHQGKKVWVAGFHETVLCTFRQPSTGFGQPTFLFKPD